MSAVRVEMNLSFREFCDLAVGIAGAGAPIEIEGNDASHIADQNAQQIEAMRYEIASLKAEIEGYDEDRRLIEAELAQERQRVTELTGDLAESKRFENDLRVMIGESDAIIERANRDIASIGAALEESEAAARGFVAEIHRLSGIIASQTASTDAVPSVPPAHPQEAKAKPAKAAKSKVVARSHGSDAAPEQSPDPSPAYVTVAEALADPASTIEPGNVARVNGASLTIHGPKGTAKLRTSPFARAMQHMQDGQMYGHNKIREVGRFMDVNSMQVAVALHKPTLASIGLGVYSDKINMRLVVAE